VAVSSTSFKPGNFSAVTHGARSARIVSLNRAALAEELRGVLVDVQERLTPDKQPVFDGWIDVLSQLRLVSQHLDERGGMLTRRGGTRPAAELFIKLHRLALTQWQALGLDEKLTPATIDMRLAQRRRLRQAGEIE